MIDFDKIIDGIEMIQFFNQRAGRELWADKPKSCYAPYTFKNLVGQIDPLFQNFEANDAKDFVNFIIMRLHEELNFVDNSFSNKCNISLPQQPINKYDSNQVLQSYIYDFQMNYNSIIIKESIYIIILYIYINYFI